MAIVDSCKINEQVKIIDKYQQLLMAPYIRIYKVKHVQLKIYYIDPIIAEWMMLH